MNSDVRGYNFMLKDFDEIPNKRTLTAWEVEFVMKLLNDYSPLKFISDRPLYRDAVYDCTPFFNDDLLHVKKTVTIVWHTDYNDSYREFYYEAKVPDGFKLPVDDAYFRYFVSLVDGIINIA